MSTPTNPTFPLDIDKLLNRLNRVNYSDSSCTSFSNARRDALSARLFQVLGSWVKGRDVGEECPVAPPLGSFAPLGVVSLVPESGPPVVVPAPGGTVNINGIPWTFVLDPGNSATIGPDGLILEGVTVASTAAAWTSVSNFFQTSPYDPTATAALVIENVEGTLLSDGTVTDAIALEVFPGDAFTTERHLRSFQRVGLSPNWIRQTATRGEVFFSANNLPAQVVPLPTRTGLIWNRYQAEWRYDEGSGQPGSPRDLTTQVDLTSGDSKSTTPVWDTGSRFRITLTQNGIGPIITAGIKNVWAYQQA